jgi:hypothetical protein
MGVNDVLRVTDELTELAKALKAEGKAEFETKQAIQRKVFESGLEVLEMSSVGSKLMTYIGMLYKDK